MARYDATGVSESSTKWVQAEGKSALARGQLKLSTPLFMAKGKNTKNELQQTFNNVSNSKKKIHNFYVNKITVPTIKCLNKVC